MMMMMMIENDTIQDCLLDAALLRGGHSSLSVWVLASRDWLQQFLGTMIVVVNEFGIIWHCFGSSGSQIFPTSSLLKLILLIQIQTVSGGLNKLS